MKYVGAHVSISGGVENAPLNAKALNANGFALFVKNQRQWAGKPYTKEQVQTFKSNMKLSGYTPDQVLPHSGYLINLGNPDPEKRKIHLAAFIDELERCRQLGLTLLNFHPGSHLKACSEEECIKYISEGVNYALDKVQGVSAILESTAGQGSSIGHRFEQLARIIELVDNKKRIGVCLDTCHIFVAGYDIRTPENFRKVMKSFHEIVDFKYLKGMHLNDSKSEFNSHLDRHENLGKGKIGIHVFKELMKDTRFDKMPLILETRDMELWSREIKLLKSFEKK